MAIAELLIRLKDEASGGIGRVGSAFRGLGDRARQAASDTSGLTAAMRDGVLQANAIQFAIGKATEAVGFLNGKFEEAKNLQLEQINAATTFAALTGQSSEEAARFIENLNNKLSISAATLPGATQDYKQLALAVQDNVLEAFKDPSGTLNQKGFEETLISMSESFGALTAASTRDIGNTSLGLSKALAGASVSELRQIAFFEQNPVILNELEKRLSSMGKELKDLNVTERVQLISDIGKKFITEDFKKSAAESVDGLMQSFVSTLFDPSAGIFGIMRDLDPATDGVQSAFSSINEALIELIGPNGVFFQVSGLLEEMGVVLPDPMMMLKRGVDFFVSGLKRINSGLTFARDFIKAGGDAVDGFRAGLTRVFDPSLLSPKGFVEGLTGFIGGIGLKISETLETAVNIAGPLFNQGVGIISQFFADPRNMYEIGVAFGALLGKVGGNIIRFLGQVDYPQLLVGIGRIAIGIGAALLGAIGGAGIEIGVSLWSAAKNIGMSVMNSIPDVVDGIQQTLVDGINLAAGLVIASVQNIPVIGQVLAGVIEFQKGGLVSLLEGGFSGLIRYVKDAFVGLLESLKSAAMGLVNQARQIPGIGALIPGGPVSTTPVMAVGSRYNGQIENAAGGFLGNLLGAARRELANMPGGSSLVMANSSETILPQGIFGDLVRGIAGMMTPSTPATPQINLQTPATATPAPIAALPPVAGQSSQGQTVSLTIQNLNVNSSGGDLQSIAQAAISEIQAAFQRELEASFG